MVQSMQDNKITQMQKFIQQIPVPVPISIPNRQCQYGMVFGNDTQLWGIGSLPAW